MKKKNKIAVLAALAGCLAGSGMAASLDTLVNYQTGDVLLCFNAGGAYNLVVDAGNISTLTNQAPNSRYAISTYSPSTQLGPNISSDFSGISWSAFTWLGDNTLFVTQARTSLNTESSPWLDASSDSQNNVALRMGLVQEGAAGSRTYKSVNTDTAVVEQSASKNSANYRNGGLSYNDALTGSYGGNFNGTFQGDPENTTPSTFATDGLVVRSDLYQMTPTGGYAKGKLLGYFEFAPDGSTTYVNQPTGVPVITGFKRVGTTNTINYTTGTYGTFTLRASSDLTVPLASWTTIATLSSGDTATHVTTDTTTAVNRYYIITGTP